MPLEWGVPLHKAMAPKKEIIFWGDIQWLYNGEKRKEKRDMFQKTKRPPLSFVKENYSR
jgi:hypothetical protein